MPGGRANRHGENADGNVIGLMQASIQLNAGAGYGQAWPPAWRRDQAWTIRGELTTVLGSAAKAVRLAM